MTNEYINEQTRIDTGLEKRRKECECGVCRNTIQKHEKRAQHTDSRGQPDPRMYHLGCYLSLIMREKDRIDKEIMHIVDKYGQEIFSTKL